MKHRNTFTKDEIEKIKKLLREKSKTLGKSDQKKIRGKLRQLGFYITDYDRGGQGFSLFDFKTLLHRGVIKVIAPTQERSVSTNKQEAGDVNKRKRSMFSNRNELLKNFADQSDKLFKMGVIRTDSFTGEIGEYVAKEHFGLTLPGRVERAIDGIDEYGNKYQVKSKVMSNRVSLRVTNLDMYEVDYLCAVFFDIYYNPIKIIRLQQEYFPGSTFSINNKFLQGVEFDEYFTDDILIDPTIVKELNIFGKLFLDLQETGLVSSRRIVGDIGEYYACKAMGLIRNENNVEKGFDAKDALGNTYEIKTRRVYESGRRKGNTYRLNNLVDKTADFLIVVVIDHSFKCDGMWKMPLSNVDNPKSADLSIVKRTPETEIIIPTSIDWLK